MKTKPSLLIVLWCSHSDNIKTSSIIFVMVMFLVGIPLWSVWMVSKEPWTTRETWSNCTNRGKHWESARIGGSYTGRLAVHHACTLQIAGMSFHRILHFISIHLRLWSYKNCSKTTSWDDTGAPILELLTDDIVLIKWWGIQKTEFSVWVTKNLQ